MSYRINLTCIVILGCIPMLTSCQENREPRLILEKAIEAHGGKESITKPRRGVIKSIDKQTGYSDKEVTVETFDLPKQWKRVSDLTFKKKRTITTLLMIEGKLWVWDGQAEPREKHDGGAVTPFIVSISTLLNLTGDGVMLTPLNEVNVNDMPAVGFRRLEGWHSGLLFR